MNTKPFSTEKNPALAELLFVLVVALLAAAMVRLPLFIPGISLDDFYSRNLPAIAAVALIAYALWQNRDLGNAWKIVSGLIVVLIMLWIDLLPGGRSDSVLISALHVPLLFWCLWGVIRAGSGYRQPAERMEFIRLNGELVIMTGLILLAGGVLTMITRTLFISIRIDITRFWFETIAVPGAAVAPLLSHYLISLYPNLTSKIAPVLARLFTPVALLVGLIYLIAVIASGARFLQDRNLLLAFNGMLLGVLALIVFSVSSLSEPGDRNRNLLVLFLLAIVAILINAVALVAIFSRIGTGITPNRMAVLLTNLLVFANLIGLTPGLFKAYKNGEKIQSVEKTMAGFLTVYAAWTVVAIVGFPLVFGFK